MAETAVPPSKNIDILSKITLEMLPKNQKTLRFFARGTGCAIDNYAHHLPSPIGQRQDRHLPLRRQDCLNIFLQCLCSHVGIFPSQVDGFLQHLEPELQQGLRQRVRRQPKRRRTPATNSTSTLLSASFLFLSVGCISRLRNATTASNSSRVSGTFETASSSFR